MEIIKEIKALHRKYIREEDPNSVILNLKDWPNVDLCYVHEDKKGWGSYVRDGELYNIGRSNNECLYPICQREHRKITRNKFKVITDNPEVKRVYEEYYKQASLFMLENNLTYFLVINPKLMANLWDYYESIPSSLTPFDKINSLYPFLRNDKAETIQDATGLPIKYFKSAVIKGGYHIDDIKALKNLGYSPEDVHKYIDYVNHCPRTLLNNRQVLERFTKIKDQLYYNRLTFIYRDYLRMIEQLPADLKKNFPLCPQDIQKHHDRLINVFNKYQQQIQEKQHEKIANKYRNNVYPLAKTYEFFNDEYVIVAPESVFELTGEGRALNHCVGSYIQSISNGKEYILFLRKKDEQSTPFFTINITPDKEIRQIHGKHNCNVPEKLVPFINSWIKKFNLTGSYNKIKHHL